MCCHYCAKLCWTSRNLLGEGSHSTRWRLKNTPSGELSFWTHPKFLSTGQIRLNLVLASTIQPRSLFRDLIPRVETRTLLNTVPIIFHCDVCGIHAACPTSPRVVSALSFKKPREQKKRLTSVRLAHTLDADENLMNHLYLQQSNSLPFQLREHPWQNTTKKQKLARS